MRKFWLALSLVKGISAKVLLSIIQKFGSPEKVFSLTEQRIAEIVDSCLARKIVERLHLIDPDKELKILEEKNIRFITFDEDEYPENLREIFDPPLVLYIKGKLIKKDTLSVAIVGTRKATSYGRTVASNLGRDLAFQGITVVSGLARGIDSSAHKGAIDVGGRTIGILGCGIDVVYPPENKILQEKVEKTGAILSEFPPGTMPLKHNFPARNRIIAGMSKGTVVVEAGLKSGALITAEFALNSGREVFAVPGSVLSDLSKGSHRLIKEGAKLVEDVNDIIEELKIKPPAETKERNRIGITDEEKWILQYIPFGGKSINQIVDEINIEPQKIMAQLSMMEIKGLIKKGPGNSYFKVSEFPQ